jgi:inosose dehydratase
VSLRVANSPASWGIEPPAPVQDPPWRQVLAEIAAAGYPGTELGPLGYLPDAPERLVAALREARLALAAGFVMAPLAAGGGEAALESATRATCALVRAGGAANLVLMDSINPGRAATAGRSADAGRLDAAGWRRLVDSVRRVAAIAADEFALRVSIHSHVGTNVEFEDELERLLADVGPDELGLCPDTGHYTYAGMDPVAMLRRHGGRVSYLHLKDLDEQRLAAARADRRTFHDAVADGIFKPLGDGCVDFEGTLAALEEIGYEGWATVEQDRLPDRSETPQAEARRSLQFLARVGIAR